MDISADLRLHRCPPVVVDGLGRPSCGLAAYRIKRLSRVSQPHTARSAGQQALDLDLGADAGSAAGGPLPIVASRAGHLWGALSTGYDVLGFDRAAGSDEVFRALVLARIIEPTSKVDSLRVLEETGVPGPSYATVRRRLPDYAQDAFRGRLAAACAKHAALGPASLVLYDVSTLYFETDAGDGFRLADIQAGAPLDRGLLLDGRRKSMQPMAERLGVDQQG